jgi:hypothetical protein
MPPPCFAFAYQGTTVTGKIRIVPQRARLRLRCEQEVILDAAVGSWKARLELEPTVGQPDVLDLYLSRPVHGGWQIRSEEPHAVVRQISRRPLFEALPHLLGLAVAPGLAQAALTAALPRGELWRIEFADRLQKKATLRLEAPLTANTVEALLRRCPLLLAPEPWSLLVRLGARTLPEGELERKWAIPLLSGRDVEEFDGALLVRLVDQQECRKRPAGLEANPAAATAGANELHYRYSGLGSVTSADLVLWTCPAELLPATVGICDEARLTTVVPADGALFHQLTFRLWNWRQQTCTIVLPASTVAIAARVDGYWLSTLSTTAGAGAQTRVEVPVPAERRGCRIELLYQSPRGRGGLFSPLALELPEPILPAPSMSRERRWRLAPGLWPLHPELLRRPAGAVPSSVPAAWQAAAQLSADASSYFWPDPRQEQRAAQRHVLGSEAGMRKMLTGATHLGAALERLDLNFLKGISPLVIDQAALAEARLSPDLPLGPRFQAEAGGPPFWTALGIVYLPCPHAALLTTTQQAARYRDAGDAANLGLRLEHAVATALRRGADSTGAFVSLAHWLREAPAALDGGAPRLVAQPPPFFADNAPGWTEWENLPGAERGSTFHAVSLAPWRAFGWALAVVVAACAWGGARWLSPVRHFRLHVLLVVLLALTAVWLPPPLRDLIAWPALLAALGAGAWCVLVSLRTPPRRASRSTMIKSRVLVSALLGLSSSVAWFASAQTAGPAFSVFLLSAEKSERQAVLVPPDLLNRLKELEERSPISHAGALIVGAKYQAKVRAHTAEFEAEFEIYNLQDQAELVLPLQGVLLKDGAFLDGVPVYPIPAAAPKQGYAQLIRGKGSHQLRLSFSARAVATGPAYELRCGIPKVVQTELDVAWAGPVHGQQLGQCQGAEVVPAAAPRRPAELHAQLGAEPVLHIRWLEKAAPIQEKALEVREAYFWDLRPGTAALTGVLHYRTVRGATAHLTIHLPEGLDLRAVEIASALGGGALLKGWHVSGRDNQRQLRLELAQPVSGELTCTLDLIPRLALAAGEQALRLPLPLNAKIAEGVLGYRLEGLEASERAQSLAVTSLAPTQFAKAWAKLSARELPDLARAFNFRRTGAAAALSLEMQLRRPSGALEATWRVQPRHADLTARAVVHAAAEEIILIEARVPAGLALIDVNGPYVHHWNLHDSLLQVWLTQPRKHVALEITGWMPNKTALGPKREGRLVLPCLQLLNVQPGQARVLLQAETGIELEAQQLKGLSPSGGSEPWSYTAVGPFEASFLLRAVRLVPEVRMLTTVQGQGEESELRCHLEVNAPNDLASLKLHVTAWPGDGPRLEITAPVAQRPRVRTGRDYTWNLVFLPGHSSLIRLTLHGHIKTEPGKPFSLPNITLEPGLVRAHWLALRGLEMTPESAAQARAVKAPAEGLPFGLGAEHALEDGPIWQLRDPHARLAVHMPMLPPAAQLKVLLAEQTAASMAPGQWLYEARYLVHARKKSDFYVELPAGARWLAAAVDGQPVQPVTQGPGALVLALPEGKSTDMVQIRWDYPRGDESAATPACAVPHLPGCETFARHSHYFLPAAFRETADGSPAEVLQLYEQARAYLRLTELLASETAERSAASPPSLFAAQQHFFAALRHLEQTLSGHEPATADDIESLQRKVRELRQENAHKAKLLGYDKARARADLEPWGAPRACPAFAPLTGGLSISADGAASPAPEPRSVAQVRATEKRRTSELLLLAGVSLFLVSYLRQGLVLLRALWPELVAFGAALGMLMWGLGLLSATLFLIAVGARLVYAARRARFLFVHRSAARPSAEPLDGKADEPGA